MKHSRALRIPILFLLMAACGTYRMATAALPAAVDGELLPTLAPMLERVTPAVVNISTVTQIEAESHPLLSDPFFRRFFDLPRQQRPRKSQSLGSGG